MKDVEEIAPWLDRLYSLNAVIAATGQPLAGNLFYLHRQTNFANSRPSQLLRPKRDRLRSALRDSRRLLEIGVNGGHSAYLALTSNPSLEFHGVDVCDHSYVLPAIEWLKAEFPGRVYFHRGNCLKVLPRLVRLDNLRFDTFHIDGAKSTYFRDILNCHRLVGCSQARVILDDMQDELVARTWSRCLRLQLLSADEQFPMMADEIEYRHAIGTLCPVKASRLKMIDTLARPWARLDRIRPVRQLPQRTARRIYRVL